MEHYVQRPSEIGPWVIVSEGWYNCAIGRPMPCDSGAIRQAHLITFDTYLLCKEFEYSCQYQLRGKTPIEPRALPEPLRQLPLR